MIVVHETADDATIWEEINYEKNTYEDAFVDGNNIIVISNTDHEAWGAGYPANGRAVQFEQIEVTGASNFTKEIGSVKYFV